MGSTTANDLILLKLNNFDLKTGILSIVYLDETLTCDIDILK